jgi:hypothetical protein
MLAPAIEIESNANRYSGDSRRASKLEMRLSAKAAMA